MSKHGIKTCPYSEDRPLVCIPQDPMKGHTYLVGPLEGEKVCFIESRLLAAIREQGHRGNGRKRRPSHNH